MDAIYKESQTSSAHVAHTHQNIMELLVRQEIDRQLHNYPSRLKPYINKVEVATFALNRLPALYASNETGKHHQLELGKKYHQEIVKAVRQGLIAVERDPLRKSTPITNELQSKCEEAEKALQKLEQFLIQRHVPLYSGLSWRNLSMTIYRACKEVSY